MNHQVGENLTRPDPKRDAKLAASLALFFLLMEPNRVSPPP